ncbi:MAG: trehalose-6-phosphate synthase [Actinobacteria bacterium]|nr:MAG: trehalose-6-phosphate synthase [Actinomycetota bacterium]REK34398.1 MAG: trehalose-6-phosphate synthase [Actinomycetota bacterium]
MTRRIIVAANRLPVRRLEDETWERSPGGLVSALIPILQQNEGVWIGWSGVADEDIEPFRHSGIENIPVTLSGLEVEDYYLGFSNETIWPLFHDAIRTPAYHRHWWRTYQEVNMRFARAIADAAEGDDLVWIQDYQLLLVPRYLKELAPSLNIRFFLHIPFPPVELYARLPWRQEVLEGMLGADVVGFQTNRGAGNFTAAATAFTESVESDGKLESSGHQTRVVASPISIETAKFESIAERDDTTERVKAIRAELGDPEFILLGADRLDYTKGIDVRFRAFEAMLERHPDLAERTKFVQIGVPSRSTIRDYVEVREEIEQIAGRINSTQGSRHYMPIHYMYESLTIDDLVAYYRAADVMVVTPFADGMNLVAKEFVASRVDDDGVLLLSEFTGAAQELRDAILLNPFHVDGIARKMYQAIMMEPEEQRRRMKMMRHIVREHDVHHWARSALGSDTDIVAV